jgi:serine/threonine protein phosphatase 1
VSYCALAVVGDIHGDAARLDKALQWILSVKPVRVVFLGDYVDRGRDSEAVVSLLIGMKRKYGGHRLTFLRGNHEQAMLDYLIGGDVANFVAHGGIATAASYNRAARVDLSFGSFRERFPDSHLRFLESTEAWYEDSDTLISHAGFNPNDPASRSPDSMYNEGHSALFTHNGPWPRRLTICGHYVQRSKRPYDAPRLICLDTGCGTLPDGPLTVLSMPGRRYLQF